MVVYIIYADVTHADHGGIVAVYSDPKMATIRVENLVRHEKYVSEDIWIEVWDTAAPDDVLNTLIFENGKWSDDYHGPENSCV